MASSGAGRNQNEVATATLLENVVIPAHLMQIATDNDRPYPQHSTRRISAVGEEEHFNILDIPKVLAKEHGLELARGASISIDALGRSRANRRDTIANEFAVAPPRAWLRKTSLPTIQKVRQRERSRQATARRGSTIGTPPVDTTLELPERVVLFKSLMDLSPTGAPPAAGADEGEKDGGQGTGHQITLVSTISPSSNETAAAPQRRSTLITRAPSIIETVVHNVAEAVHNVTEVVENVAEKVRRSSMYEVYEKAKKRGQEMQRKKWAQNLFEYTIYTFIIAFIYFVLIGLPLWKGAVYWLWWVVSHKWTIEGTVSIVIGIAFLYAFTPLLILFEKDPPPNDLPDVYDLAQRPGIAETALLIPCYKSAGLIANTLEAALKVFPPSHVFVISNGNSPTPLDNTEEVCRPYGVNHIWSPVGSKIVAQFVGCYAAKGFNKVLLIDDDCALGPNFPIVSDRMNGNVQCYGYTIKSVGPNSSRGTLCQQAQDLEYKLSGIQRALAGKVGSATFPHGAISIWDRMLLIKTFHEHPGFSVSEDWFFGHVARKLGCRIKMCTSTFVETETPSSVFFSSGGARGGFGEMTVFQQRFKRWNFFFVTGMYYNMAYILGSWKLGFFELGAKLFVFQEVYETILYLLAPFVIPITFLVRPDFTGYVTGASFVMYYLQAVIFNEVHLRLKGERVGWLCVYVYYLPYKLALTAVNVASCYWSLYKYARYFAKRHPKVIDDEKAVEIVLRLEEDTTEQTVTGGGRRMTVTAIGARASIVASIAEKQQSSNRRSIEIATKARVDPNDHGAAFKDFAIPAWDVPSKMRTMHSAGRVARHHMHDRNTPSPTGRSSRETTRNSLDLFESQISPSQEDPTKQLRPHVTFESQVNPGAEVPSKQLLRRATTDSQVSPGIEDTTLDSQVSPGTEDPTKRLHRPTTWHSQVSPAAAWATKELREWDNRGMNVLSRTSTDTSRISPLTEHPPPNRWSAMSVDSLQGDHGYLVPMMGSRTSVDRPWSYASDEETPVTSNTSARPSDPSETLKSSDTGRTTPVQDALPSNLHRAQTPMTIYSSATSRSSRSFSLDRDRRPISGVPIYLTDTIMEIPDEQERTTDFELVQRPSAQSFDSMRMPRGLYELSSFNRTKKGRQWRWGRRKTGEGDDVV